jgi:hypothetical protein
MTSNVFLSLISWTINAIFLFMATYLLYRRFMTNRVALNLMVFIFLYIFTKTVFMLAIGLIGFMSPVPILIISAAGIFGVILLNPTRNILRTIPTEISLFLYALKGWWWGLPRWLRWFSVLAGTLSAVRFAFLIWALPPFVWDSLTYHLTNVAYWTQAGKIELFETSMTRIYTPANFETLATWFTVFIHHDIFIEAAGIPVYVLGIVAVYAAMRGLQISPMSSWLAALAYGSMPALMLATTGTKNDPHVAAYFLAAMAIVIDMYRRSDLSKERNPLGQLLNLVLILMLAAGTKAYIAIIFPGLLLIGWLGARSESRKGIWGDYFRAVWERFATASWGFKTLVVVVLLVGLFIGGFWNTRNLILTGNPFYPYGIEVGSESFLQGAERDARVSLDRLKLNFTSMLDKFWDRKGRIAPDIPNTTGWGWFVYGIGLTSILLALILYRDFRIIFAGFLLSFVLLFTTTRPSPWNFRYMLWFPALFSFGFGLILDRIRSTGSRWQIGIIALVILSLGLNFVMTLNYGIVPMEATIAMLDRAGFERDSARFRFRVPEEYESAIELTPKTEPLGYNVHHNGFIYPWFRSDFSQRLVYVSLNDDDTCVEVANKMRKNGVKYLSVAPEHTDDLIIANLQQCAIEGTSIRERGLELYVIEE